MGLGEERQILYFFLSQQADQVWIKLRQGKKASASYLGVSQGGRLFLSCQQINPPENICSLFCVSPCCRNFTLASLHFLCLLARFHAPSLSAFEEDLSSLHEGYLGVAGWKVSTTLRRVDADQTESGDVLMGRCWLLQIFTVITVSLHIIQSFCLVCLALRNDLTDRSSREAEAWRRIGVHISGLIVQGCQFF